MEAATKQRGDYRDSPKYKAIAEMQEEVRKIKLPERTIKQNDAAGLANEMAVQFEKEANATEKHMLWWLNKKLEQLGEPKVDNVEMSMQDGVYAMKVLELLSGKKAPKYTKKARMAVQRRDNWVAVVKFMKSLGIQGT